MVGTAVGIGASLVGSAISGDAASDAAAQQAAAADRAAEVQKEMFDLTREDLKPYRQTGVAANKRLSTLMGLDEFDRDAIAENLKSKYGDFFNIGAKTEDPSAVTPAQQAFTLNTLPADSYNRGIKGSPSSVAYSISGNQEAERLLSEILGLPGSVRGGALTRTPDNAELLDKLTNTKRSYV